MNYLPSQSFSRVILPQENCVAVPQSLVFSSFCLLLCAWTGLIVDMSVFDSLRFLSTYIKEAHLSGKQHCADLYEIVQYAGNIVPRMYLMITVGRYLAPSPLTPRKPPLI